jgi:hypothetical protein
MNLEAIPSEEVEEEEDNEFLDDIEKELANVADVDSSEQDQLDAPDWLVEEGKKTIHDPNYIFCPAQHRKGVLKLFVKHFNHHPLLPDPTGTKTSKEIRTVAVWEMYSYCFQLGLAEVWAYMWTSWYCPKMWGLWARSTSPIYLSRLRTTMTVENFW